MAKFRTGQDLEEINCCAEAFNQTCRLNDHLIMSKTNKDFHMAIANDFKHALQKDGWIITHDPLYITAGGIDFYLDLGAERLLAAERHGEQIAVEIKVLSFNCIKNRYIDVISAFI